MEYFATSFENCHVEKIMNILLHGMEYSWKFCHAQVNMFTYSLANIITRKHIGEKMLDRYVRLYELSSNNPLPKS
jgi:hypothetical protein